MLNRLRNMAAPRTAFAHPLYRYSWAALATFVITIDIAIAAVSALNSSLDIPTYHLDGAFQTAASLYRLADGQWPGRDFFPYLGLGVTYLLYPVFWLAGGNVTASVFAAHFLTGVSFLCSLGFIGALFFRTRPLLAGAITATAGLLILIVFPELNKVPHQPPVPGNSLRPLRSVAPFLAASITYILLRLRLTARTIHIATGSVAGVCVFWSNDFGIPTGVLLILVLLIRSWYNGEPLSRCILYCFSSFLLTASLYASIFTAMHPIELLRYNFVDVRHDQYWYFGPWSGPSRIFSVQDFISKFPEELGSSGAILIGLVLIACAFPSAENMLLLFIALSMVAGCTVATVGGHRGYMAPAIFWCQIIVVIGALALIPRGAARVRDLASPSSRILFDRMRHVSHACFAICLLVSAAAICMKSFQELQTRRLIAESDSQRFFVPELGGYLPASWRDYVETARTEKDKPTIEEYWGIWSAVTRNELRVSASASAAETLNSFCSAHEDVVPPFDRTTDTPFDLTDSNWSRGVARHWAGFFVTNWSKNLLLFQRSWRIRFADGSIRSITQAILSGPYLNIYLDGEPLDPAVVGHPNRFEVLE